MSQSQQKTGVMAGAGQSVKALFQWRQRQVVVDENGVERVEHVAPEPLANPITLLRMLTLQNWIYYIVGFLAWTFDAYDFHALSIQTTKLAAFYDVDKSSITTAITLTLLLRSVGAVIFGIAGDLYGRKWPLVINCICLGILQVGTIYAPTFSAFLGVRSLFGIMMGGVFGGAAAMALENVPMEARGLLSGIFQQGYSFGYVIAACVNLGVGGTNWTTAFWIGAAGSIAVGLLRAVFPESKQFLEAKAQGKSAEHTKNFRKEAKLVLKQEWRLIIYSIILMALFNFFSHTTQDSYTTFMKVGKGLDNAAASRASIIMKTGACVGGTIIGYISQSLGRRRMIFISALMACILIPAWVLPNSEGGLMAGGFMLQFFVQGAWGVIPVHLNELSPPAYRASFSGITYQIGNLISSPSAQIVNELAEKVFTNRGPGGKRVEGYQGVMAVATAIIAIGIAFWIAVGPERKGSHFEMAEAAGAGANLGAPAKPVLASDIKETDVDSQKVADEDDEKKQDAAPLQTLTKDAN